jgi:putative ABC transport system permease protein
MLKSLGLVWIPGVIAGMIVSGANSIYASIYQLGIATPP